MDSTRDTHSAGATDPLGEETWYGCEARIREFESAWRLGRNPAIEDYLTAEPSRQVDLLRELVHIDLEFRIKSGQPSSVESYLERFPVLNQDPHTVLDLIAAEYELRCRRESDLDASEYGRRFPAFQSRLPGRLLRAGRRIGGAASPLSADVGPPLDVAGYEIIGEIGRGGMGVVYRAIEASLGRHVALKFVPPELSGDPLLMQRFVREAQTASALNHPHICTVHALGEHAGCPFMVLEFIEGQTLRSLVAGRLPWQELARVVGQVAAALAAAHAAGVVHRDIKPENVMVRPDGYVKVLDFGLARRLPTLASSSQNADSHETWPGALLGTVAYMSPEQARGEPLDGGSDIFSLGIVLYQLVTGRHPFERSTPFETLHAIANAQPAPMTQVHTGVPPALAGLLEAMLHKDPRVRPTAADVERALAGLDGGNRNWREPAQRHIVRRDKELNLLRHAVEAAEAGRGSMVCVAGEPGIGKSTLVEDFLDELQQRGGYQLARGRCSERQSAISAYLPILDALADLLRGDSGGTVERLMRVLAPTWLAQLSTDQPAAPSPSPLAFSQQSMLRELVVLVAEASRLGTLVLFIDDVHWADVSTVDLLAYLGRPSHTTRVLIIVTYRPTELLLGPHPFHRVKLELQGQGVCSELALGFLERTQIERYLNLAFPGHGFPQDFADLIHSRTEGSPLFLADLLRYLRERGVIEEQGGQWRLARELPDIWDELPETVRSMIQRKLERLDEEDRRLLSVAAAQGHLVDSVVVAEAVRRDPAEVEERLQDLDRVHGLVRLLREDEFPDGTPTLRFAFVHVLYQQALYAALLPTRRRTVSKALAESWERHLGNEPSPSAAELACLYEAGREPARAAQQFYLAAQHAGRVFAHRDAIALARRGLGLLAAVPDSPSRQCLERQLQTLLGLQLQVTEGYAARSAELAYERARQLNAASPESPFPVLWGLWLVRKVRSELPRAQELADELLRVARQRQDLDLALQAHQALGLTALCRGLPTAALHHVEQVAALYHPDRHRLHAFQFGQDPGVICKAYGAVALWLLGHPEAAQRQSNEAIEMSQALSPTSQSVALHFAAMVFQLCGQAERALNCANASALISNEHGFAFWLAGGTIIGGWALAACGYFEAGVARLRDGLVDWRATGSLTYMTYYLGLLAETLRVQGELEAAAQTLDEALALVEYTDERMFSPELHRLRGEVRLQQGPGDAACRALARQDFEAALELARRQEARALESRAAQSLAQL